MLFFFEGEEGIRDDLVTGVQTCALPIYRADGRIVVIPFDWAEPITLKEAIGLLDPDDSTVRPIAGGTALMLMMKAGEIGRASCRERVEISVGAVSLKKKEERHRAQRELV